LQTPFTQVRSRSAAGSGTSSRVTSHGPVGPCVSKPLPIIQVGDWNCQSRTETSFPTM
jgi:hypothetical protein